MPVPITLLPGDAVQILFTGVLAAFAVLVGQALFEYGRRFDDRVAEQVTERKHPDIRYVLYHIFWAPIALLTAFGIMRVGLFTMPPGSVASTLSMLLDIILVATIAWGAVRTIRAVATMAGKHSENTTTEA
jgi:polyferredoxin